MTAPEPPSHPDWFERTGHCGGCGQPGNFCLCTPRRPCGCAHMHEMGSGLAEDALEAVVDEVSDDQETLFDVGQR